MQAKQRSLTANFKHFVAFSFGNTRDKRCHHTSTKATQLPNSQLAPCPLLLAPLPLHCTGPFCCTLYACWTYPSTFATCPRVSTIYIFNYFAQGLHEQQTRQPTNSLSLSLCMPFPLLSYHSSPYPPIATPCCGPSR